MKQYIVSRLWFVRYTKIY